MARKDALQMIEAMLERGASLALLKQKRGSLQTIPVLVSVLVRLSIAYRFRVLLLSVSYTSTIAAIECTTQQRVSLLLYDLRRFPYSLLSIDR